MPRLLRNNTSSSSSSSSTPKTFRCGIQFFQRRFQQRQYRQKRNLQRLTHRERLDRISRHNFLGHVSIAVGIFLLIGLVAVVLIQVSSWNKTTIIDSRSAALLSGGVGMGLGISFVLVFAESSRHFRWATKILTLDEELQEVDTITTQEDAELIESYFDDDDDDAEGNDELDNDKEISVDDEEEIGGIHESLICDSDDDDDDEHENEDGYYDSNAENQV